MEAKEMNLGENIYKYRTMRNCSQGELANELEVSRQSVSKWENNSAVPELEKLIRMSNFFEISLDELVYGRTVEKETASEPASAAFTVRTVVCLFVLLFGMVFFLLSVFWGDHLRFGEAFGELVSLSIVLLSTAFLATDNKFVLAASAVLYFVYSIVSFGILHVHSLTNYFFTYLMGMVILVWFIVWGMRATAVENKKRGAES